MTKYCADLELPIPLFKSTLDTIEFLKEHNTNSAKHYTINVNLLSDDIVNFFSSNRLDIKFVEVFYRPAGVNSHIPVSYTHLTLPTTLRV